MQIGQLAETAGIDIETVRYYQHIGLLGTPEEPPGGLHSYGNSDVTRLHFIKRAQQLGFSPDEVAGLLRLSSADCADVQELARYKLNLVRHKLAALMRIERVLEDVLSQCGARKPHEGCPIIETLNDDLGNTRATRLVCLRSQVKPGLKPA